jgi:hypothetical protein
MTPTDRAPQESEYTVEMVLNEWCGWAWRRGREAYFAILNQNAQMVMRKDSLLG